MVLFPSEEKMEQESDTQTGAASAVMACCCEEGAECERNVSSYC